MSGVGSRGALASIASLQPYQPGRAIAEIRRLYGVDDVVKLASNENPLGPSPQALTALRAALGEAHRYPEGGSPELRRALARRHGVAPGRILLGNGSNEILSLLARIYLAPGRNAVVAQYAFAIYAIASRAAGAEVREVPARAYGHDLAAMAEAITADTAMVVIANPNTPTGTMVGRTEWEDFLGRVPRDVIVVCDEAYAEFVTDPTYPDAAARPDAHPGLVVLRTFSKIHGLAGLRVGWGIASVDVVALFDRIRDAFNVNLLGEVAALAALDDHAHVERTRRVVEQGRRFLERALVALGLPFVESAANFLLVEFGEAATVAEALLRAGVITRPVTGYGLPRHLRITVGLPEENTRLVQTLAALLGRSGPAVGSLAQAALVGDAR